MGLFYAQRVNFVTSDLTRHIKNGEIFLDQLRPISKNFYSYTQPERYTINHHWGSGVIFYLLWKSIGFKGLSLFYILLHLLAFFFFFRAAEKSSNFNLAFFFAVLSIPLLVSRTEIRPEGFSYLLLGIYFCLLSRFKESKLKFKGLLIIPLLQILWVNLHIFFFMGPFLIAIFLFNSRLNEKNEKLTRQYLVLFLSVSAACLVNPFGIHGALTPLTIFKEYGYMIVENQSIIFMQKRFLNPVYFHFEFLFLLTVISFVGIFIKKNIKHYFIQLILMVFFGALSWKAIRAFPLFGFFFIPVAAGNFYFLVRNYPDKSKRLINRLSLIITVIIILIGLLFKNHYYSPFKGKTGLGLMPGVQLSASFFKKNKIPGPIFNNYDIGGYLIYHLFPAHRVFVDNRPEAYSVSLFQDTYIPMQEDDKVWERMETRYNFNVIYFYRHDMTPWAQPFLIRRIQDPKWAPVFVDNYTLILLKRNRRNEGLIKLFELPEEIFKVSRSP